MSQNPRIGVVLRVPIEIVLDDESKIDQMIGKLGDVDGSDAPDKDFDDSLEQVLKDTLEENGISLKQLTQNRDDLIAIKNSPAAEILQLGSQHAANVLSIAKNPSGFILTTFMKKFAKGAGALMLAMIIIEAIKFGLDYLTKDGMPWDRRFKRIINAEVMSFIDRMMKAQLRQGFRSLIVTTMGGLRGGYGNVGGNIYSIVDRSISSKIPANFYGREISAWEAQGFNPTGGNLRSNTQRW